MDLDNFEHMDETNWEGSGATNFTDLRMDIEIPAGAYSDSPDQMDRRGRYVRGRVLVAHRDNTYHPNNEDPMSAVINSGDIPEETAFPDGPSGREGHLIKHGHCLPRTPIAPLYVWPHPDPERI